jgi:hypothetical protein
MRLFSALARRPPWVDVSEFLQRQALDLASEHDDPGHSSPQPEAAQSTPACPARRWPKAAGLPTRASVMPQATLILAVQLPGRPFRLPQTSKLSRQSSGCPAARALRQPGLRSVISAWARPADRAQAATGGPAGAENLPTRRKPCRWLPAALARESLAALGGQEPATTHSTSPGCLARLAAGGAGSG